MKRKRPSRTSRPNSRGQASGALQVVHPDAAGIDIGARTIWVAIESTRDECPVRSFGTCTADLDALADWLLDVNVTTVAMEATGVYWIPLYEVLEDRGLEVVLVNPRFVKHVPGRKSDVLDCQWLLQLHTHGLLRGSFRPAAEIARLRAYTRYRDSLVRGQAHHVQHMQKALSQMNLKVHHVVSDLTGQTGMAIVRALADGETDPQKLAALRDPRCKSTTEDFVRALTGTQRPEHLFTLRQALDLYDTYLEKIRACDGEIEGVLHALAARCAAPQQPLPPSPTRERKPRGHQPRIDIRAPLHRLTAGVDLTQIHGIAGELALRIVSEIGTDMSPWPSAKHFASWLRLTSRLDISGGRVLNRRTLPRAPRAAALFRQAAVTAGKTSSALGAFYRRIAFRKGAGKAVVATARKIATLVYSLLKTGAQYVDPGEALYLERNRQRAVRGLRSRARQLGFQLVPTAEPAGQMAVS